MKISTYIDKDGIRRFTGFNGWRIKPVVIYVRSAIGEMQNG